MATKTANKEVSNGICHFCKSEIAKKKMTQHLKYCKQRIAAITIEAENAPKSQKARLFHIVVEGRYNPKYWMHLEVPTSNTMADLDVFLRDMWLECCDHLSAFKVGTTHYSSQSDEFYFLENEEEAAEEQDETVNEVEQILQALPPAFVEMLSPDLFSEMKQIQSLNDLVDFLKTEVKEVKETIKDDNFLIAEKKRYSFMKVLTFQSLIRQLEDRDMETSLAKALKVGQKFTYEYDFGSTTDLALRVVSEREGVVPEDDIAILARNSAPVILCCVCGKPAKRVAAGYYAVEENAYCSKICAKKKNEYYTEMLPVVNSPRVGVCAYTGED